MLATILSSCLALHIVSIPAPQQCLKTVQHAAAVALCSAAIVAAPAPAPAAQQTLDEAIVEFTEAVHPILAVQNTAFPAFTEQVAALIFGIVPDDKLARSIEVSIDALTSVPPEKVDLLNGAVKEAFDGLDIKSCQVVPLPDRALVDKIAKTEAVGMVDSAKLKALDSTWGGTLSLLPKSDAYPGPDGKLYSVMCLPPPAQLDKLALAQASVGRAIGSTELQAFKDYVPTALKTIRPTDAIPLAKTAEKLAYIPPEQKLRFNSARKGVEKAAEAEAYKARLAAINARSAAAKAALAQKK